jgi:hypothetical protein
MERKTTVKIEAIANLPDGVRVFGDTVFINVGKVSPRWVRDLARTEAGTLMLCRIVDGILYRGVKVDSKAS